MSFCYGVGASLTPSDGHGLQQAASTTTTATTDPTATATSTPPSGEGSGNGDGSGDTTELWNSNQDMDDSNQTSASTECSARVGLGIPLPTVPCHLKIWPSLSFVDLWLFLAKKPAVLVVDTYVGSQYACIWPEDYGIRRYKA